MGFLHWSTNLEVSARDMPTHLLNLISFYLSYKLFFLFYGEVYLINA